jgi:hypothetical protein
MLGLTTEEMAIKCLSYNSSLLQVIKLIDQVLMLAPYMTPPLVEKVEYSGVCNYNNGRYSLKQYVLKSDRKYDIQEVSVKLKKEAELPETTYNDLVKLRGDYAGTLKV